MVPHPSQHTHEEPKQCHEREEDPGRKAEEAAEPAGGKDGREPLKYKNEEGDAACGESGGEDVACVSVRAAHQTTTPVQKPDLDIWG